LKSIAIIPARGGSKRIPRKNVKDFLGKPIIAYSIQLALDSGLFDEVMVSTDDEEIADISRQYGAKVPFLRSARTSDDFATTADVLIEVLETYQAQHSQTFEAGCCIYATAPLVRQKSLHEGHKLLVDGAPVALPVAAFSYPVWRSFELDGSGSIAMKWPEYEKSRSQDLQPLYHDCGQWYWFRVDTFLQTRKLFQTGAKGVITDELEVQDIDNITDWKLAELKYRLLHE
jgi:N-acylneuraminate cytidylyltransferase